MKVIFAHDHFFYKFKGEYYSTGGLTFEALSRYLIEESELTVIARCKNIDEVNGKFTKASGIGIKFVEIADYKSPSKFFKFFKAKNQIKSVLGDADFVISRMSSIGNLTAKLAFSKKLPVLVEVVGCPFDSLWYHSILGKFLAPIEFFKFKKIVKKSDYAIYVTENYLQQKYPMSKLQGNFSNVIINEMINEQVLERQNLLKSKNDVIKIGTIGNVGVKYKGQDIVINALKTIKDSGHLNYHYYIVGNGNSERLVSLVSRLGLKDNVTFLGQLSSDKIIEFLDMIDIYIQPSKTEGLPRALIEAMSRGKLCIGTNVGGIPELLDQEFIVVANHNDVANILKNQSREIIHSQGLINIKKSEKFIHETLSTKRSEFLTRVFHEVKIRGAK